MTAFLIGEATVPPPKNPIVAHAIEAASQQHGIPYEILLAVAHTESRYRLDAVSRRGAQGLFQLMPATAQGLQVDPWNPAQAADGAARLLKGWLAKYRGSWAHALAAYVWGPARVDRAGGYGSTDWPQSVVDYVRTVLTKGGLPVPFCVVVNGVAV